MMEYLHFVKKANITEYRHSTVVICLHYFIAEWMFVCLKYLNIHKYLFLLACIALLFFFCTFLLSLLIQTFIIVCNIVFILA